MSKTNVVCCISPSADISVEGHMSPCHTQHQTI